MTNERNPVICVQLLANEASNLIKHASVAGSTFYPPESHATRSGRCFLPPFRHRHSVTLLLLVHVLYAQDFDNGGVRHRSSASFDALPPPLHLNVLLMLPHLVDRVRCSLVARSWAALLHDPAFWSELSFEGIRRYRLDNSLLLGLCRRAAGRLTRLDLTADACKRVRLVDGDPPFLGALAAEALIGRLEFLAADSSCLAICSLEQAIGLHDACPALTSLNAVVDCSWPDLARAMCLLPFNQGSRFRARLPKQPGAAQGEGTDFVAFCRAMSEALFARPRIQLTLQYFSGDVFVDEQGLAVEADDLKHLFQRCTAPAAAIAAAAVQLGAALVDPLRGPRELVDGCALIKTPVFGHMCRGVSEHTHLRRLEISGAEYDSGVSLSETDVIGFGAALASGRFRLDELAIEDVKINCNER